MIAVARANLNSLKAALQQYSTDTGRYPCSKAHPTANGVDLFNNEICVAYAALRKMPNGKTADDVLNDQLTLLSSKMDEVADAVHKKDSDALLANGRFLEEKFGASPLALPQAS